MSMISILCMSQINNNNNNVGTPGGYEVVVILRLCRLIMWWWSLTSPTHLTAYTGMICFTPCAAEFQNFTPIVILHTVSLPLFLWWLHDFFRGRATAGWPHGPLLFCDTIQPLVSSMESVLNLGYLDDLTLGGPAHSVASDDAHIVQAGGDMGLVLNTS